MPLLTVTKKGIYCAQADFYIDPWKSVDKALITHAHADHARKGSKAYISHNHSVPILKHRLGNINISGVKYGEVFSINGVKISFHPAGHIIGSAQIRVEYKGEIWVASGDYKTENDQITPPIEIIKCHGFITESTFGLPAFNWESQALVFQQINEWWKENKAEDTVSIIAAYSLGKAQRLIHNLDHEIGDIYVHNSINNINKIVRNLGYPLKETKHITAHTNAEHLKGNLVLAPFGALRTSLFNNIENKCLANASGWMAMRKTRKARPVDKGFVLSDHADWNGLLDVIKGTGASEVIVSHGYTEIFSKHLRELGLNAYSEETAYKSEQEIVTSDIS